MIGLYQNHLIAFIDLLGTKEALINEQKAEVLFSILHARRMTDLLEV